jgi:hypothetical protein
MARPGPLRLRWQDGVSARTQWRSRHAAGAPPHRDGAAGGRPTCCSAPLLRQPSRRLGAAIAPKQIGEGNLSVAGISGLFSRRILGYAMSRHYDAALAFASLQMAVAHPRRAGAGGHLPLRQGSEYTAGTACTLRGQVQPKLVPRQRPVTRRDRIVPGRCLLVIA